MGSTSRIIEIRLLGTVDVRERDGTSIKSILAQPKRTALLAYLAAARPHGLHQRETLLGLFWPEMDGERARKALRQSLYYLKASLGEDALVTIGEGEVGVSGSRIWCDVVELERAFEARPAEVWELYAGDLMPGFHIDGAPEFEQWLETERSWLRRRTADAAWRMAQSAESDGDANGAVEWARRAAALAPSDELPMRRLVELLDRAGDRSAALLTLDEFTTRLRREYDLEPSRETFVLIEAMRKAVPVRTVPNASTSEDVAQAERDIATERSPSTPPVDRRTVRTYALALAIVASILTVSLVATRMGPATTHSIAVLPLANLSADRDEEFFADGLTRQLINVLGSISSFSVTSETSTMQLKGSSKGPQQIARELDVNLLVEGSVIRDGTELRINVQLIDGTSNRQIWSQTYRRAHRDVLSVQHEIALAIADAMEIRLTRQERIRLARERPVNPQAHEAWQRGEHNYALRTPEGLERCLENAQDALAADSLYAPAYVLLANCSNLAPFLGIRRPAEAYADGMIAARRAAALDPDYAEAHTMLATSLAMGDWDWTAAGEEYAHALRLNPSSFSTRMHYANFLSWLGHFDAAISHTIRGVELSPLHPAGTAQIARVLCLARRYDEALEYAIRAVEHNPDYPFTHLRQAEIYEAMGRYEEAIPAFEEAYRISPDERRLGFVARAYALAGRRDEALKLLAGMLEREHNNTTYVPPTAVAAVYAGLGDNTAAMMWLEKGYAERDPDMVLLQVWPVFDSLRTEQKFRDLLQRMRFPSE